MANEIIKKVVLLGDSAVGKTSLIRRFVYDEYGDGYISTIGAKVSRKEVEVEYGGTDYKVMLMIWDVIGSQGFESTQAKHIAGLNGAILVSDLSRQVTNDGFEKYWIPLLSEVTAGIIPPMLFMGNKLDLVENKDKLDVTEVMMTTLESKYCGETMKKLPEDCKSWLFTSAKTGENVEQGFKTLVTSMIAAHPMSDPTAGQIDYIIADGIYAEKERNTPRAIMDMIVADSSQIVGSEPARKILQGCIGQLEISKEEPTIDDLNNLIECILKQASDLTRTKSKSQGIREYVKEMKELENKENSPKARIEKYREIWTKAVNDLETIQ